MKERSLSSNEKVHSVYEKGKENNKEKKSILVRHLQVPNSISTSFLHNFSVIVTFVIKRVPEWTCLKTISIILMLALLILPIAFN